MSIEPTYIDLDDYLDDPYDAQLVRSEASGQEWRCDCPDKADWLLRKMARAQRAQEAAGELATQRIAQIECWLAAEQRRHQHQVDWAAGFLEGYLRRAVAADPSRKTLHFPSGELRARKQPDTWEVDAEAVVAWAQGAGRDDLLVVKVKPDLRAVKAALAVRDGSAVDPGTGERVPGVTVSVGEVRYSAHPES